MLGLDPNEIHEYIPEIDLNKPIEVRTVFLLKCLTHGQDEQIQNIASSSTGDNMGSKAGTIRVVALRFGLKGWKNFSNKSGSIKFEVDELGFPKPEMFDYIPRKVRDELADEIIMLSRVEEEEAKKYD